MDTGGGEQAGDMTTKIKMWKAPPRREYKPKSDSPGQRFSWTRTTGGCWSGGHFEPSASQTREGTIWSAGPEANSLWVVPDDAPGDAVAVKLPSAKYAAKGHQPAEMPGYCPTWQRDTLRRVEHLRASDGVFAEFETRTRYVYGKGQVEYEDTGAYHCDRECPEIKGQTRACWGFEPSVGSLTRMLLDASARGRSDLCRRCVYLSEPAEVYEDEPLAVAA